MALSSLQGRGLCRSEVETLDARCVSLQQQPDICDCSFPASTDGALAERSLADVSLFLPLQERAVHYCWTQALLFQLTCSIYKESLSFLSIRLKGQTELRDRNSEGGGLVNLVDSKIYLDRSTIWISQVAEPPGE